MIAKRVAMKSVKKSSFIALIGYLLGQQGKSRTSRPCECYELLFG